MIKGIVIRKRTVFKTGLPINSAVRVNAYNNCTTGNAIIILLLSNATTIIEKNVHKLEYK